MSFLKTFLASISKSLFQIFSLLKYVLCKNCAIIRFAQTCSLNSNIEGFRSFDFHIKKTLPYHRNNYMVITCNQVVSCFELVSVSVAGTSSYRKPGWHLFTRNASVISPQVEDTQSSSHVTRGRPVIWLIYDQRTSENSAVSFGKLNREF